MPQNTSPSPASPTVPSPSIMPELRTLKDTLHLIFHHNRNQHRRSIWWRSFTGFRRAIQHLLMSMDVLNVPVQVRKSNEVRPLVERRCVAERRIRMQLAVWRDFLADRWFLAFSHLTTSTQFSSLGLVLLSALARASSLLGVTGALQAQSRKEVHSQSGDAVKGNHSRYASYHQKNEDPGEVVERSVGETASLKDEILVRRSSEVSMSDVCRPNEQGVSNDSCSETFSARSQSVTAASPQAVVGKKGTFEINSMKLAHSEDETDVIDELFDGLA